MPPNQLFSTPSEYVLENLIYYQNIGARTIVARQAFTLLIFFFLGGGGGKSLPVFFDLGSPHMAVVLLIMPEKNQGFCFVHKRTLAQ